MREKTRSAAYCFIVCLMLIANSNISKAFARSADTINSGKDEYYNPVLHADYSDPDVIRVGSDFYLISSSFAHFPGIPILHSTDLVNWKIISHAVQKYPAAEFDRPQHGNGIWAPSLRYHNDKFYIYFGDPDRGVFMTWSKKPEGPWAPLRLIKKVTGWIDCCPFWDDDGNAYLVHAFANSRCGIKSLLAINRMNIDGAQVLDDGVLVFNGQVNHPTIEGPKLYKRNGYYYIFAPAGGVKTGWQTVLRSKNIWGPYEDKIVLQQGKTNVNGPHQGAWVTSPDGRDWFIHFQDRYAYGRIVHLQPLQWKNEWPVIGYDESGDGAGEPVKSFQFPGKHTGPQDYFIQTSDEFDSASLGLQWQWNSNYKTEWYSLTERPGYFRLFVSAPDSSVNNLWEAGNLLLQKLPAAEFSVTARCDLENLSDDETAGLLVFGIDYSSLCIKKSRGGREIVRIRCINAPGGTSEERLYSHDFNYSMVYFRVEVKCDDYMKMVPTVKCRFSYSSDGSNYIIAGPDFTAREGKWVGAKVGLFAAASSSKAYTGFVDVDWVRFYGLPGSR